MKMVRWLVLVTASVVLAAPSVAMAETESYTDPSADAVDSETNAVVPEAEVADITAVNLDFAETGLTAVITLRDVDKNLINGAYLKFRDSKGRRGFVIAEREPGSRKQVLVHRGRKSIRCAPKAKFDGDANVITVTAPSKCFGKVRWIRVGALTFAGTESKDRSEQFYVDDSRRDGEFDFPGIKLGARLYKG